MLLSLGTMGDIREGKLYFKINGKDYEVLPNTDINGNWCFRGLINVDEKHIYEIIARVEKDGIIIGEYDLIESQNLEEIREAIPCNQYGRAFIAGDGEIIWANTYYMPLMADKGQADIQAVPHEAFLGLQHLEKVYDYYEKNNQDAKLLKLAIEIVKQYSGWEGMY